MTKAPEDMSHDQSMETPKDIKPTFYIENGLMVFTEAYHLSRGYCCKSGCRHCPYGYKKKR